MSILQKANAILKECNPVLKMCLRSTQKILNNLNFSFGTFLMVDAPLPQIGEMIGLGAGACYDLAKPTLPDSISAFIEKGKWQDLVDHQAKFEHITGLWHDKTWDYFQNNAADIVAEAAATGIISMLETSPFNPLKHYFNLDTHLGLSVPLSIITQCDIKKVAASILFIDMMLLGLKISTECLDQQTIEKHDDLNQDDITYMFGN